MALTGTYLRTLDEKHRLAVPKPLRVPLSGGEPEPGRRLFVAPETERSLGLYAAKTFDRLAARLAEHTQNRSDVRNYMRLFYSRAEEVELDAQGRIRIPERLVEYAGLAHEVVLLGVHDHAEIWDRGQWEQFLEQHGPEFDQMADRAFE